MLSGAENLQFAFVLSGAQAASLSPKQAHFLFDQAVLRLGNGQRNDVPLLDSFMADRQLVELRDRLLKSKDPLVGVHPSAGASNSRKKGNDDRGGNNKNSNKSTAVQSKAKSKPDGYVKKIKRSCNERSCLSSTRRFEKSVMASMSRLASLTTQAVAASTRTAGTR
jgi:hypothetical protein